MPDQATAGVPAEGAADGAEPVVGLHVVRRAREEALVERGVGVLHEHEVVGGGVGAAGGVAAPVLRGAAVLGIPPVAAPALGAGGAAEAVAPVRGGPALVVAAVSLGHPAEPQGPGLVERAGLLVAVPTVSNTSAPAARAMATVSSEQLSATTTTRVGGSV